MAGSDTNWQTAEGSTAVKERGITATPSLELTKSLTRDTSTKTARLGHISFINSLPITIPVDLNLISFDAELIVKSPAELNQGYESAEIDLGAMSSFYYLDNPEMELMPGISISSTGAVGSVLCFSKKEFAQLDGANVTVPKASATSVNLLKVLLAEKYSVRPNFISAADPQILDQSIDAALVFGDLALTVDDRWSDKYLRLDLGAAWQELTGLPMVFGLWAARSAWAKHNRETLYAIGHRLRTAAKFGLSTCFSEVIDEAERRTGLQRSRLHEYYRQEINYDLTDKHLQGLVQYGKFCKQHGLLKNRQLV